MNYYDLEKEHGDIRYVDYIYNKHGRGTHAKDGYEYTMTLKDFEKDLDDILTNITDEEIQREIDKYRAVCDDAPDSCPWDCGSIAEHFYQDGCWQTAIANYVSVCWDCEEEEEEEG